MYLQLLSHAEQVAVHLRQEILSGRWQQDMPGADHLQKMLGVNHVTVNAALQLLEKQGLLVSQGPRKKRRIAPLQEGIQTKPMRVRILLYDAENRQSGHINELLDQLHRAGFHAHFSSKTLHDLGMDPIRVARFVRNTDADAWVVVAGSREVLAWFAAQATPSIALFGRFSGLPIAAASPRAAKAITTAVRRLVLLGHHRIVMLARAERRKPTPALVEQLFLDELKAQGVATGSYNLPDWDDTPEGLICCLNALFQHTPPSALICGEPRLLVAAQQHLARRGIFAPEQVSLICNTDDPTLGWCQPEIAHIHWDHRPLIQRVVRWAQHMANGKPDQRQALFNGKLVEGGTIGPARIAK